MIDIVKFRECHEDKREIGRFSDEDLDKYKNKLSNEVIDFLKQEGKCTYSHSFFWTILPEDYHEILDQWGLDGYSCYAFLRSSFGSIVFYKGSDFFSLNPYDGTLSEFSDLFRLVINNYLQSSSILEITFWFELHQKNIDILPVLKEDEIYALDPTIPEGGSPETSKIVVAKLKEHLQKLADLFDHTTTE